MRKVAISRWIIGIVVLAAWCTGIFSLQTQTSQLWLHLILGFLFAMPQLSFWEWVIHGTLYHKPMAGGKKIREIHLAHHWGIFPPKRYVHEGPYAFMNIRSKQKPYQTTQKQQADQLTTAVVQRQWLRHHQPRCRCA